MNVLNFQITQPLQFNWTGKFIAPDENWTHITRALIDYEFIGVCISNVKGWRMKKHYFL